MKKFEVKTFYRNSQFNDTWHEGKTTVIYARHFRAAEKKAEQRSGIYKRYQVIGEATD